MLFLPLRLQPDRAGLLKAYLRKAAERSIHGLWNAIGHILNLYSPQECANYFANAGYDAARSEIALAVRSRAVSVPAGFRGDGVA